MAPRRRKITVRLAETEAEAQGAHAVIRENAKMLGFVTRGSVIQKMLSRRLVVALGPDGAVVGCICFGVRRERTATIYEIAASRAAVGSGVGKAMIAWLKRLRGVHAIKLKCTADNTAGNEFYRRQGFSLVGSERGRKRRLMIWRLELGGGFFSKKVRGA